MFIYIALGFLPVMLCLTFPAFLRYWLVLFDFQFSRHVYRRYTEQHLAYHHTVEVDNFEYLPSSTDPSKNYPTAIEHSALHSNNPHSHAGGANGNEPIHAVAALTSFLGDNFWIERRHSLGSTKGGLLLFVGITIIYCSILIPVRLFLNVTMALGIQLLFLIGFITIGIAFTKHITAFRDEIFLKR